MSIEKTQALQRQTIPVDLIDENTLNPNRMSDAEFNMLYDNMEKVGFVDPVFVRKMPNGRYRMIGGHHRLEVGKLQGYTEVPATIIDDPAFDEDQEKFQLVRMNVIHGRMTPDRFLKLYESLNEKYSDEVMAEAFGFAEEEEFRKLIQRTAKSLPKEMQEDFKKAAKELKTIDGLSHLLNTMFTNYGSTLDTGYMVIDYGGKESIWLRSSAKTHKALLAVGEICRARNCSMDHLVGGIVQLIAQGKITLDTTDLPTVVVPDSLLSLPTLENLKNHDAEEED